MTNTMPPTLQQALEHHEAGNLPQAAYLYREILTTSPRHADAYHLLGVLMHQLHQSQTAVELINQAIEINSSFAPFHNNLGNALMALGDREQARACFRRSIELHRNADTYINLATLDLGEARLREAKAGFEAALRLSPKRLEGMVGLGRIAAMQGKATSAKRRLEEALTLDPACVSALNALGEVHIVNEDYSEAELYFSKAVAYQPSYLDAHVNLGNLHMRLKRSACAVESYLQAFQLSPNNHGIAVLLSIAYLAEENAEAAKQILFRCVQLDAQHAPSHHLLGHALVLCGSYQQALTCFERCLDLGSDPGKALNGIGTAYEAMGKYAHAASALERALELEPDTATYLLNLGLVRARQNDRQAISLLDRAVALDPTEAKAHIALGESLLSFGDYKRGFAEYEWRWRCPVFMKQHHQYEAPLWDGSPLLGKTILIHAEQGLGDTIQFIRFLPQVARYGGKILLVVPSPLFRLFESLKDISMCLRSGVDALPSFDVRCPLLSLPAVLGTESHTIPPPINLSAIVDTGESQPTNVTFTVGLVWAGSSKHKRDHLRSLSLGTLLPLQKVAHCRFVNLQKEVPPCDGDVLHTFAMEDVLNTCDDLLDTANAMKELNLVVCVDTCVAHLAATLGKDVWLILPEAADWRWGNTGDTTRWYPTMKLFRKMPDETADRVIERLVRALEEKILVHKVKARSSSKHQQDFSAY